MSAVTTHVLDAASGLPATGLPIRLVRAAPIGDGGRMRQDVTLAEALTDSDGRVRELGPESLPEATYRLHFDTGAYFTRTGRSAFYPEVVVTFAVSAVEPGQHVHVPLLLSPFAYSTYRGS